MTLIGCPKLDEGDYSEKLTQIIANNDIGSNDRENGSSLLWGWKMRQESDSGFWQIPSMAKFTISIDGKILEA